AELGERTAGAAEPLERVFSRLAALSEEGLARGRDVVDALAFALLDAHVSEVLEQLKRGVDRRGRRRRGTDARFDRFQHLRPGPRSLLQDAEDRHAERIARRAGRLLGLRPTPAPAVRPETSGEQVKGPICGAHGRHVAPEPAACPECCGYAAERSSSSDAPAAPSPGRTARRSRARIAARTPSSNSVFQRSGATAASGMSMLVVIMRLSS